MVGKDFYFFKQNLACHLTSPFKDPMGEKKKDSI